MHPALMLLLRLRQRSIWRRTLAAVKTPRGAALLMASGLLFAFMVLPQFIVPIVNAFSPEGVEANRAFIEAARPIIRAVLPLLLLAFVLLTVATSWGESAIYFTPADVDFLFAGPFSRRDLLLYKLAQSLRSNLLAGTFFAIFAARYSPLIAGAWLGTVLTLLFINGLTLSLTLLSQVLSQAADSRWRRAVIGLAAVLIACGVAGPVRDFDGSQFLDSVMRFHDSLAGRILLSPLDVFARVVTAPTVAELAGWGAVATVMVGGLFALAIGLDANHLEAGLRVSQRHYERLQRRRQGGGAISAMPIGRAQRIRLPPPAWLSGVGPNLWRQSLLLLRRSQGLMLLIIIGVVMAVLLIFLRRQSSSHMQFIMPIATVGAIAYQSLLAAMQLPTGFRGDMDRLEWLKSLPLHPMATALGEIGGAAIVLTLVQAAIIVTAWITCGGVYQIYVTGLVTLLPINLLFFGVENLMFLMFPIRISSATAGDFQFMGKFALLAMVKMFGLLASLAVAAAGAVVYLIVPQLWAAVGCCLLLLLFLDSVVVLAAGKAFERFDVSRDIPPA